MTKAPLSVEQAQAQILSGAKPIADTEVVPLLEAAGRVLNAPLCAKLTQPPFDASAMDGYAVRASDVATLPATLETIGESAAGHAFDGAIGPGQTVRIFTGAPVPQGADAIVIQENTTSDAKDGGRVTITDGTPDSAHIRPRGGDFSQGETLIDDAHQLTPRDLTLAAAMGYADLKLRRRPVVAILPTGDELVEPGATPNPDQIVSSNTYGLSAMVRRAGGVPLALPIARDTRASLKNAIAQTKGSDVLLTIGGASVGDHDLVGPVLHDAGMTLNFCRIAMRPGKPLLFGTLENMRVIGLPGNPVSSLICARVFLVPLLRQLQNLDSATATPRQARLQHNLPANGPRQHYMRAKLETGADGEAQPQVTAALDQDSSLMVPLAAANALIVRPPHDPALEKGAFVDVLDLDF